MDDVLENRYIELNNKKREEFMRDKSYGSDMCDLVLQQLNFKKNNQNDPIRITDIQGEIFLLFSKVIDLYPDDFEGRNTELLKASLIQSFHSLQQPELLLNSIPRLVLIITKIVFLLSP